MAVHERQTREFADKNIIMFPFFFMATIGSSERGIQAVSQLVQAFAPSSTENFDSGSVPSECSRQ